MTLKALREIPSLSKVPAIFMTAKNLAMELDSEIQASVIGSIQKPFDAMGLPDQLLRIWRKSVSA
jgi:CheY-like chemotaxis protein